MIGAHVIEWLQDKYHIDLNGRQPIPIREMGRHDGFIEMLAAFGYTQGAEIGVEQGHFSECLCKGIPGLELWCIDPYQTYDRYADHVDQAKLDHYREEAIERLKPYDARFLRYSSAEAVGKFKPQSIDFVYIDGNHDFEFVVNDIIYWSRIVRPGGIVAGHDYKSEGREKTPIPFHVIQATQAYTSAYRISPWFLTKRDRTPSWFWIKP